MRHHTILGQPHGYILSEIDTDVYCHGLARDNEGRKMSKSLGNVIDPIDVLGGISLDDLHQKLLTGNLAQSEVKNAERFQEKAFPQGNPEVGADALRFSLVNYTQVSGIDVNFDVKTMYGYRKFCNKIYQATKYVLGKLGDDFIPRESSALTGQESLSEKWILTKTNTVAKQVNQALEEREFAKSTQAIYRYLYDDCFDIYIENSKLLISDGTPEEARSAMDILYTTFESGLRLMSPFMPFLTEELGSDFRADQEITHTPSQLRSIQSMSRLLMTQGRRQPMSLFWAAQKVYISSKLTMLLRIQA